MAIERKFIQEQVKKLRVDMYIHKELERFGCGDVEVKRTPLGNRIVIHTTRPGLVIGRKGKNIEMLTNVLKKRFKMDNPQIEVQEISKGEFDPNIMANQLAGTLERGIHFRKSSYSLVRQIMGAGALGVQIGICGKVSGGRSRMEKFKEGYIKHCGDTADKYVKTAVTQAKLKAGVLGINVKITPPMSGRFGELAIVEKKPEPAEKKEGVQPGATPAKKEAEKPVKDTKSDSKKEKEEKKPKPGEKKETKAPQKEDKK
jgi:small subunit ribosomal protein S3|tara:strand:- start:1242 stop:2015 length:774 start_codon:yes stop_codon:yes gene_type:complete